MASQMVVGSYRCRQLPASHEALRPPTTESRGGVAETAAGEQGRTSDGLNVSELAVEVPKKGWLLTEDVDAAAAAPVEGAGLEADAGEAWYSPKDGLVPEVE